MADNENPPHDELADEQDQLGWDRREHGRMADYATPDTTVPVERAEPGGGS